MSEIIIKKPEVLAPAGSMESLRAAVSAGCDAVYIGGSRFGARAYADNPATDEMIQAIDYCHMHGVKIYMTVNTLLKEREIDELYDFMLPYYKAGLDAVIVQDFGVMKVLHECFPKLDIHASTQMTITMGQSSKLLEEYGVNRIVPARELSLKELYQMREDTDCEIEVFVHGALCYCYSGQCLFSSMLGGRSGNRGRCAQPCRMPYKADGMISDIGEYILSPKESCNLLYLGELIEAGVDSLKIEGRMKKPEYTALVTSLFRKYVDLYAELGKDEYKRYIKVHHKEFDYDIQKLAEIYNRNGFTQGYLEGKTGVPDKKKEEARGDMLSSLRPKHGGVCVGEVVSVGKRTVSYKLTEDIYSQDVVEFRDEKMRQEYEYTIGEGKKAGEIIEARYKKGCMIHPGDKVYRTKKSILLDEIREKFIEEDKKIKITGRFFAAVNEKAVLTLRHAETEVTIYGEECQMAQKRPADDASVRKSIMQTGNSEFEFEKLDIELKGDLFLPVGVLKNLRREGLLMLKKAILEKFRRRDFAAYKRECTDKRDKEDYIEDKAVTYIASVMTMEQLDVVADSDKISKVYIKTELLSDDLLEKALDKCHGNCKKAYLMLPHIFRKNVWDTEEKKLKSGKSIINKSWDGYVIRNLEEYIFLTQKAGIKEKDIVTDAGIYIMNTESYSLWRDRGIQSFTIPYELTSYEMRCLTEKPGAEMIIYTHIPMMVSAQCVSYNTDTCAMISGKGMNRQIMIKDMKGREFIDVNYCKYCYNTIYQKEPMSLMEYEDELYDKGIRNFRYDFTVEDKDKVNNILMGQCDEPLQTGHYINGVE